MVARDWRDGERAQPVVQLRGRDRGDHLPVELLGKEAEPTANVDQMRRSETPSRFFGGEKFLNELLRSARSLGRFQMRDVMFDRIGDRLAERFQLLGCVLRHDAQRRWKLRVLNAVAFQFSVLERGERIGLLFGLKETALALSRLAVVHHEFQMRTIAVAVSANPDFTSSHAITVATLLPQKQVNSRYYAFLCVTMIDARKTLFSEWKRLFQSEKTRCSEIGGQRLIQPLLRETHGA